MTKPDWETVGPQLLKAAIGVDEWMRSRGCKTLPDVFKALSTTITRAKAIQSQDIERTK